MRQAQVIRAAGLLAALLIPLAFNPWAVYPFEPAKILLFEGLTAAMLAAVLLGSGWWRRAADRSSRGQIAPRVDCDATARGRANSSNNKSRLYYLTFSRAWRAFLRAIAVWVKRSTTSLTRQSLRAALLIYAAMLVLATIFSIDPGLSLWGSPARPNGTLVRLSGVVFCWLLGTALPASRDRIRLLRVLVLGSVAVALYGLVQAAGFDPLAWRSDSLSPVFSTLGRSNFLGAYLAMLVPLTLYLVLTAQNAWTRRRYGLIVVLQVICLALTLARGAWLGLVGGGLIFVGLLAYRRRSRALWGLAVLVLVTGSLWFVAMDRLGGAADDLAAVSSENEFNGRRTAAVNARYVIWQESLHLAGARWLLGYGPATFETVFMANVPPALAAFEGPQVVFDDPHNILLDQLLSGGALMLLAWLAVVGLFCRQGWRILAREADLAAQALPVALLAATAAYLVQAQFNPDMLTARMIFWILVALQFSCMHQLPAATHLPAR